MMTTLTEPLTEEHIVDLFDPNKSPRHTSIDISPYYTLFHQRSGEVCTILADSAAAFIQTISDVQNWMNSLFTLREDEEIMVVYVRGRETLCQEEALAESRILDYLLSTISIRYASPNEQLDCIVHTDGKFAIRVYRTYPDSQGLDMDQILKKLF